MASNVVIFADSKARLLGRKLHQLQCRLDSLVFVRDTDSLADVIEEIDILMSELDRCAGQVTILDLRIAVTAIVRAYRRWSAAKLGSEAERLHAHEYLRCLDRLEQVCR